MTTEEQPPSVRVPQLPGGEVPKSRPVGTSAYEIYTDGAYNWGTEVGGWAALIIHNGGRTRLSGHQRKTTSNRMELLAAIKALEAVPEEAKAALWSDSEYLIKDMQSRQPGARPRKRNANLDLWRRLDELASLRTVEWRWVQGHTGHPENEEANALAEWEVGLRKEPPQPAQRAVAAPQDSMSAQLDAVERTAMVDVGGKEETAREALARGSVFMSREALALIQRGGLEKGDALAAARIAGVMAAKETPRLIPLCHPLPLTHVSVDFALDATRSAVHITSRVRTVARTGVEMEALVAVAVAALTIYDMAKAVDRGMRIEGVRLVEKRGGASGEVRLE